MARLPELRPAAVSVLVVALQTSDASVPKDESVLVVAFQTFSGMEVASEEDAARTAALVFVLILEASEVDAAKTAAFVFAFTLVISALIALPSDDDAVVTSDWTARLPEERLAPVRVRVPLVQTSAASVPNPVSVRLPAAHTFAGMEVMDDVIEVNVAPSEVEAVSTCAFVLALILEASELEAVNRDAFVFAFTLAVSAVIAEPKDEEAVVTSD